MDVKDSDGCMGSLYNTSVVGKCCLTVGASLSLFFFLTTQAYGLVPIVALMPFLWLTLGGGRLSTTVTNCTFCKACKAVHVLNLHGARQLLLDEWS